MAFELEEFHRNISDDELIADLVRVSLGGVDIYRSHKTMAARVTTAR